MELVIIWILFGVAGAIVLSRFNKAGTGCLLGGLLGPIGLIIAFVMRGNLRDAESRAHQDQQAAKMASMMKQSDRDICRPRPCTTPCAQDAGGCRRAALCT